MSKYARKRSTYHWPIWLSSVLMVLNVTLMVCWIVLLSQLKWWPTMTIGTIVFSLILIGLSFYLFLTIKEIHLSRRQANFVDSVTHELKTPIASLRLYLETLEMRSMDDQKRKEFYHVMETELQRLDDLISQLLEVGRLDAIGEQSDPEDVALEPLLRECARTACVRHKKVEADVFRFDVEPAVIHARRFVLELVFNNLLDNAIKYAADIPEVIVAASVKDRGRIVIQITDNGEGVPPHIRTSIFKLFFRGGSELERRRKGTGLGLYIVHTLVRKLKGKVSVTDRDGASGSVFEVELPGRTGVCES